jgi:hypothetical protein
MQAAVYRGWNVSHIWPSVTYRLVYQLDGIYIRYLLQVFATGGVLMLEIKIAHASDWVGHSASSAGSGRAKLADQAMIETSEVGAKPIAVPQGPPT